jgi:hypothetical protein
MALVVLAIMELQAQLAVILLITTLYALRMVAQLAVVVLMALDVIEPLGNV